MTCPRPGSYTLHRQSSGQPLPSPFSMGEPACLSLGSKGDQVGVSTPLGSTKSPSLLFSSNIFPSSGLDSLSSPGAGNSLSVRQGGYRGGRRPGFYGRIFVVPKSSGGWRPVLDLSSLNRFLLVLHFRMETPRSIRDAMHPNDWAVSIDLKDAYFHILVHPADRKFLRFVWKDRVFQFKALPFGLAPAPWLFTKIARGLSGRLAAPCFFQQPLFPAGPSGHQSLSGIGICYQRREVRSHSQSALSVPGHVIRHDSLVGLSFSSSFGSSAGALVLPSEVPPSSGEALGLPSQFNGISVPHCSTGQTFQTPLPTPISTTLVPGDSILGCSHSTGSLVPIGGTPMAVPPLAPAGGSNYTTSSTGSPLYRRLHGRVGCSCRCTHSLRTVVGGDENLSHQSPGVGSRVSSPRGVPAAAEGQTRPAKHGQHDSCVLYQ